MDNVSADFTINENQPLQAEYTLGESEHFDCSFELFATGTAWGLITGNLQDQTDLWNVLSSKADTETVEQNLGAIEGEISDLSDTVDNNYTTIVNRLENDELAISNNSGNITSISNTIQSYGDIVTYNASSFATSAQGALADTALQSGDNISELVNNVGYITSASLPTLEDLTTQVQRDAINSGATTSKINQIASNTQAISTETTNRQNADNNLQSQIDAITASSDVTDIVGTYAQLQAYDTSTLAPNSIIKVLQDEHQNNETTYYRWVITGGVGAWVLIGEEGPYYTKSEADGRFVPQTRTINGKDLSNNISLDASDVGALPSSTVIPTVNNGTLDIQVNGTSVGTFTANQSGNTTANIIVPDSATWGNITGNISNQTDLQNALDDKQDKLTAGTDLEIVQGSSTHNLPEGYTEVEYIQAGGDAGIITSVAGNINTNVTLIANCTRVTSTSQVILSDGYDGNGGTYFGQPASKSTWGTGGIGSQITSLNVLVKTEFNISSTITNTFALDGTVAQGSTVQTFSRLGTVPVSGNYTNWSLFGSINKSSNTIAYPTYGRIYYAKFEQNNTVVAEYVPAIRNSDYAVGLYDIINDTFIARNLGTGTLIAGEKVAETATINFINETGYITGIDSSDVTTALGYTPYNSSNPNGYTSNVGTVTSVNNVQPVNGNVTLSIPSAVTESTVSGWGFTKNTGTVTSVNNVQPVNGNVTISIPTVPTNISAFTNDSGYITSSALTGYATQSWVGEQGYITGISSSDVTTALGYTPYNSSNPNGYTSNVGTVTSVNNVQPVNGNVTLSIPSVGNGTVTFTQGGVTKGSITMNQSGNTTIDFDAGGSSGIQNTATGTDSLTILGTPTTFDYAMNIGIGSSVTDDDSIAIGQGASVSGSDSLGIGRDCNVSGDNSIQLGNGTLIDDNVFQVWNYPLLDYPNGEIFEDRIPTTIARTSQIPSAVTESTVSGWGFTKNIGTVTSVNNVQPVNGNVTIAIPDVSNFVTNSSLATTLGDYVKTSVNNTTQGTTASIGYQNDFAPTMQLTYGNYQMLCGCGEGAILSIIDTTTNTQTAISAIPNGIAIKQGQQLALLSLSNNNLLVNGSELLTSSAIANMQTTGNLVTSISSSSTDSQYPSAKCMYDIIGDIETLLQAV